MSPLSRLSTVLTRGPKSLAAMQTSITKFLRSKQTNADSSEATSKPATPTKRAAENDETDMKKRLAIASPSGTPSKSHTNFGNDTKQTPSTPSGDNSQSKGSMSMSPLIAPDVLIKKKIAQGASALHENIGNTWFRALQGEFDKEYFRKLSEFVTKQRQTTTVYPPPDKVFTWTHFHSIKDTRVVILGQDPYHGPNQAHGLSFSVQKGVQPPPSLINIFKELETDIKGFETPSHGDLTGWAKQGVLMLNTCLTVNRGQAFSHKGKGWETFTDSVISWISRNNYHKVVFILWGKPAQTKEKLIDKRHKILRSPHPSPLSAYNGFFGCQHFSRTNEFLRSQGLPEIDWKAL